MDDMTRHSRASKILVVDDHPLVREGFASRISAQPDMQICGEAADVEEGLAAFNATMPDLTIVDLSLKAGHGLDLIKEIAARAPKAKMLVVSAFDESLYAERALRAGAMGYLGKQECRENVIDAIRTVLSGRRYLSPQMTERLLGHAIGGRDSEQTDVSEKLSDRELQVFQLIGQGLSTGAIAKQLRRSPHTIDTHREKIKTKLNLKTGAELTQRAVQWSLENR
jgi:DNA-binding NarL/FixJ family response regulator